MPSTTHIPVAHRPAARAVLAVLAAGSFVCCRQSLTTGSAGSASPSSSGGGAPQQPDAGEAGAPDASACGCAPDASPVCDCGPNDICVANECRPKGPLVAPTFAACTNPPCMNVYNNCTIPLWTHAIGTVTIDDGNVRELMPNAQFQYAGLSAFGGGRIYAYYRQPSVLQPRLRVQHG